MSQLPSQTTGRETVTPEVEPETETAESEAKAEAITEAERVRTENNQLLLGLMSDPDIQEVLNARREKRAIKVVADGQETSGETEAEAADAEEEEAEIEGLDDDVKKIVKLLGKKVDKSIGPITERLAAIEELAQGYQRQAVDGQVKTVASKYKDFDKYRKQMAQIVREIPGASVEELFLLAKHRAGDLSLVEPSTHSERPTPTPRRTASKDKKVGARRGRKGFQSTLIDALERIDFTPRD